MFCLCSTYWLLPLTLCSTIIYLFGICSNGNVDLALEQVEDLVASHLVLWTAAEQLAITQAFEKVSNFK